MTIATVDPLQNVITFGEILVTGFADATFCEVEYTEDSFTSMVGADGEHVRARTRNDEVKVKLTLLQTSQSNQLLSAAHEADRLTLSGRRPFQMVDLTGTTRVSGAGAYIKKLPAVKRSRGVETVDWEFILPKGLVNIGSSTLL